MFTALKELGFDNYEEQLREFLRNYNAEKEDVIAAKKAQKRAAKDHVMTDLSADKRAKIDE